LRKQRKILTRIKLIGGCTAWSSRVTVNGTIHQARFWYNGKNLNNAKEDAAEVALWFVSMVASSSAPWMWAVPPAQHQQSYAALSATMHKKVRSRGLQRLKIV
jgi:hypothetical protein